MTSYVESFEAKNTFKTLDVTDAVLLSEMRLQIARIAKRLRANVTHENFDVTNTVH